MRISVPGCASCMASTNMLLGGTSARNMFSMATYIHHVYVFIWYMFLAGPVMRSHGNVSTMCRLGWPISTCVKLHMQQRAWPGHAGEQPQPPGPAAAPEPPVCT